MEKPCAMDAGDVLAALQTQTTQGLSNSEVESRLLRFGPNQLIEAPPIRIIVLFLRQLRGPIVWLLLLAAFFSLATQEYAEFTAILVVLLINSFIGFFTEYRAIHSMQALREMTNILARVRRDGELMECAAETLVPGDILILDAGDVLAADARLVLSADLACDESALTGESLPVSKSIERVDVLLEPGDQSCMLFKGCGVSRGTAEAVVTATGMDTELGRISELVANAESEHSPLEKQLASLSRHLIWATLGLAVCLLLIGMYSGQEVGLMIQASVALAVAAIPEGLPIVATLALARGMLRMSRHNALIARLSSVETLGATTVILTDKTGTLTENHMRVAKIQTDHADFGFEPEMNSFTRNGTKYDPANNLVLTQLFRAAVLCNNASYNPAKDSGVGDPMEVALLEVAAAANMDKTQLQQQFPQTLEHAFDSSLRLMATVHSENDQYFVAVKGAPKAIFECVSHVYKGETETDTVCIDAVQLDHWDRWCDDMAGQGLRLLAVAGKTEQFASADPYSNLTLYGVVALNDPARTDVASAIADAKLAGIRVIMATGDHLATARFIADSVHLTDESSRSIIGAELADFSNLANEARVDLLDVDIFARVNPQQKLDLIELHQQAGQVVAMTGDGVNDAPALKKADIGIAMGTRGTQVAKDASDMILKDDAFPTIVHAIREGRAIYCNIRRFTVYLLSCNLSEILTVTIAIIAGLPLPLLPLQILFLNLVTDVFPAFALGTIEPGRDVLKRPPRTPGEPILGKSQWRTIVIHGITLALTTLGVLWISVNLLELKGDSLTTVCFLTLAISQLWHLFGMHNWREGWLATPIASNRFVWLAVAICTALLGLAMLQPHLASLLNLVPLDAQVWTVIITISVIPWLLRESSATLMRHLDQTKPATKYLLNGK